jgi:putative membrane protein
MLNLNRSPTVAESATLGQAPTGPSNNSAAAHSNRKGSFAMRRSPLRTITIVAVAAAASAVLPLAATATASAPAHTGSEHHHSLNSQDKEYLKDAAQGALWEIRGGYRAQHNAAYSFTKAFGMRMIVDHSKEYQDAKRTAAQVHQPAPTSVDPAQNQVLYLLSQLHGSAFDCAYLSTEWADHMADVNGAKLELAAGRNEEVKELAAKYLPVLEQHLSLAEADLMKLHSCKTA